MYTEIETSNPTLPVGYDIVWAVLPVVAVVLAVVAVVGILRATYLSGGLRLVWLAIVVLVPVLGAIAWLIARYARPRTAS